MNANRNLAAVALLGAATLLSACNPFTRIEGDGKALAKLDGDWTVTWVAGKEIDGVKPQLVFDTAKRTVTGNDGCNSINGTFSFDAGRLKAKTTSTRKACPNDAAKAASAEIANLFTNGAEVVEVSLGKGHVVMMRNDSAEIRMIPSQYAE